MKKILLYIIILLLIIHCGKKKNIKNQIQNESDLSSQTIESDDKSSLDFEGMKIKVEKSEKLDPEVFLAISALHKYHITQNISQAENLSKIEQQKFYEKKKKEFFDSIKYTEEEYTKYMENNLEKLNEYQNEHPAIRNYLTTIN